MKQSLGYENFETEKKNIIKCVTNNVFFLIYLNYHSKFLFNFFELVFSFIQFFRIVFFFYSIFSIFLMKNYQIESLSILSYSINTLGFRVFRALNNKGRQLQENFYWGLIQKKR